MFFFVFDFEVQNFSRHTRSHQQRKALGKFCPFYFSKVPLFYRVTIYLQGQLLSSYDFCAESDPNMEMEMPACLSVFFGLH